MDNFAFIIHPIDPKRDVSRKYPLLGKILTEGQINFFPDSFRPFIFPKLKASHPPPQAKRSGAGWWPVLIRRNA